MQRYDALQFLADLVCDEADTDVCLDALLREVEYRPCLQIALCNTECPFHVPKTVILGYNLYGFKIRVGDIAFQTIPLLVVLYLFNIVVYQTLTNNQQVFKKSIMIL